MKGTWQPGAWVFSSLISSTPAPRERSLTIPRDISTLAPTLNRTR